MTHVDLHLVTKSIRKLPDFVIDKLNAWVRSKENYAIREFKKVFGYHDEPLKRQRKEQRSIRLTKAYLAIYTEHRNGLKELETEFGSLTFGRMLRSHRIGEELSQVKMAKLLKISKQSLNDLENGRTIPSISRAGEIAKKLALWRRLSLNLLFKINFIEKI